jgi:endo-1,4-beta-D-glucanase Y
MATKMKLTPRVLRRAVSLAGAFAVLVASTLTCSTSTVLGLPASLDAAKLWQAYANRFISADGRVIDPQGGDRTTSEGQSYALFFALVNNDRAHFDKLFAWTESNLAANDLGGHLPSWSWGRGKDGHWGTIDPNSASDSDLWIAYDLIEAGRLWKDRHYQDIGQRLESLIAQKEVANLPGLGPVLLPGPTGFKFQRYWVLNPSYTPLFLLNRMATADPDGPWSNVATVLPTLLSRSAKGGYAMDWVCYTPGEGFSPCQASGKKTPEPLGSYDAIRVYLWAGMLPESAANPSKSRILHGLAQMNVLMQSRPAPPEKINSDGVPMNTDGPVGFSAALLPYLKSNSNDSAYAQQLVRIQSQLDEKSNLYGQGYGTGPTYYDQNLVLFGSGWNEKQFQFGTSGELLVRWSR